MVAEQSAPRTQNTAGFLAQGGEIGALMRARDWSATALGPAETWSSSIKTAVSLCLSSRFPILLWIGPELRILYNDAYIPFLGSAKHPAMLGEPGRVAWGEIWSAIGPMHDEVQAGRATWVEDFQMFFAGRLWRGRRCMSPSAIAQSSRRMAERSKVSSAYARKQPSGSLVNGDSRFT